MSKPKTFSLLKPETEAALPEVDETSMQKRAGVLAAPDIPRNDLSFKSPINRRLANILWQIRNEPPDFYMFDGDSLTLRDHLKSDLNKVIWIAFEANDAAFFEQLAYALASWEKDESGIDVPSNLKLTISTYYLRAREIPAASELCQYVNRLQQRKGQRDVTLQNVIRIAKSLGLPIQPGKTGKRSSKVKPTEGR